MNPVIKSLSATYYRILLDKGQTSHTQEDMEAVALSGVQKAVEIFNFRNPSFINFAQKVIINNFRNEIRYLTRYKRKINTVEINEEAAKDVSCTDAVIDEMESQYQLKRIYEEAKVLPEMYSQIFHMHYVKDMSIREIAETLGVSYKTAYIRIKRLIKLLKERLKEGVLDGEEKRGH